MPGSYQCACKVSFSGDGKSCSGRYNVLTIFLANGLGFWTILFFLQCSMKYFVSSPASPSLFLLLSHSFPKSRVTYSLYSLSCSYFSHSPLSSTFSFYPHFSPCPFLSFPLPLRVPLFLLPFTVSFSPPSYFRLPLSSSLTPPPSPLLPLSSSLSPPHSLLLPLSSFLSPSSPLHLFLISFPPFFPLYLTPMVTGVVLPQAIVQWYYNLKQWCNGTIAWNNAAMATFTSYSPFSEGISHNASFWIWQDFQFKKMLRRFPFKFCPMCYTFVYDEENSKKFMKWNDINIKNRGLCHV